MQITNCDYFSTCRGRFWETKKHLLLVARNGNQFHLFEGLDPALHHTGLFNIRSETIDPVFDFFYLLLLICIGFTKGFKALIILVYVVAVVTFKSG